MKYFLPFAALLSLALFTSPPWGFYPSGKAQDRAWQVYSGCVERSYVVYNSNSVWITYGTNSIQGVPQFVYDRTTLVQLKDWTEAAIPSFVNETLAGTDGTFNTWFAATNSDFPMWTVTGVVAACLLPTNYLDSTPFAGLSMAANGWRGMTNVLARLLWTRENSGPCSLCNTNPANGQYMTNVFSQSYTSPPIGADWAFSGQSFDCVPSGARNTYDDRKLGKNYRYKWDYQELGWSDCGGAPACDWSGLTGAMSFVTYCSTNLTYLAFLEDDGPANTFPDGLAYDATGELCPWIDNGTNGIEKLCWFSELLWQSNAVCSGNFYYDFARRGSVRVGWGVATNFYSERQPYFRGSTTNAQAWTPGGGWSSASTVYTTETFVAWLKNGIYVSRTATIANTSPMCDTTFLNTGVPDNGRTNNNNIGGSWAARNSLVLLKWDVAGGFKYK